MLKEFGKTILEISESESDIEQNIPVLKMYDDKELIGTFNILTNEVIENIDLADYDIRFVQKQIELNRDNYLETWIKNTVNTNRLP
ncbi:hypothetical protein QM857_06555 [Streptococcus infantis]|jgi:hypothetical protein|uniref:hypothetical protein n=1 Tax=Streptococcus TaxID=1301 RepID=UPI002001D06E|nr:hypothetical protein [Streptococcus mitis]